MVRLQERETRQGQYDMAYDVVVIDHPTHGRLLLAQGFGGLDSLRGGTYRWEHGVAVRLQPDDTMESLRAAAWNEHMSLYEAAIGGHDPSRPVMDWSGEAIRALATASV